MKEEYKDDPEQEYWQDLPIQPSLPIWSREGRQIALTFLAALACLAIGVVIASINTFQWWYLPLLCAPYISIIPMVYMWGRYEQRCGFDPKLHRKQIHAQNKCTRHELSPRTLAVRSILLLLPFGPVIVGNFLIMGVVYHYTSSFVAWVVFIAIFAFSFGLCMYGLVLWNNRCTILARSWLRSQMITAEVLASVICPITTPKVA